MTMDLFGVEATDTPARPSVVYGCCDHCTTEEQAKRGQRCADAPHDRACIQPDCGGGRPIQLEQPKPEQPAPVAAPPKPTPASTDDSEHWYNKW